MADVVEAVSESAVGVLLAMRFEISSSSSSCSCSIERQTMVSSFTLGDSDPIASLFEFEIVGSTSSFEIEIAGSNALVGLLVGLNNLEIEDKVEIVLDRRFIV